MKWSTPRMKHKNIVNSHFTTLKNVIHSCIGSYMNGGNIVSDISNASLDTVHNVYVYPQTSPINLDVIKLDDLTKYRKHMLPQNMNVNELSAVDAICINSQNEWFFIEFKNSSIQNDKTRKSIRKKMIESIWYVFFMYSKSGEDINNLFGGDFTKFARNNIHYIIVGSQSKNTLYSANIQSAESSGKHYTPPGFEQYKGYYFKDVYMLTELELRNFILRFQV